MRILSIHIDGFGKFRDRQFEFGRGTNLVCGHNEAGKSTLHTFMEAMLLGPNRRPKGFARSPYEAMEPWDADAPYGGSMRIEYDGNVYCIERNFRNAEQVTVYREENGEEVSEPEEFLKTVMEDLTPDACRNTISIGQLSAKTGAALQRELTSYVENVGSTANPELNAERAVQYLEQKKEKLRAQIRDDAAKDYAASLSRIKNIENDLNSPEYDNHIRYYEAKRNDVRAEIGEARQDIADCGERIEDASRTLLEHQIRTREDVAEMEATAEGLFNAYDAALAKKRSGLRLAGLIMVGLVFAAALTGTILLWKTPQRYFCLAIAVLALAGLAGLIVAQCIAAARFRKAEQDVLDYMAPRIGGTEVDEKARADLLEFIHGCDGLLEQRENDTRKKEELEENLSGLMKQDAEVSDNLTEQTKILVRVEGKLSEENSLRNQAAALRQRIAENNRIKEQIDAIDIAIDTIGDLSETIRGRLGTYLNNEASRVLKSLTDGHYRSMDIGSGNDVSLNSSGGMISVSDVSAGTMDQVYLAVRMAAARFMMKDRDSLPLIFDDSFALYDDERLASAVNFVASDYQGQVFIFTCHRREEKALEGRTVKLVEL